MRSQIDDLLTKHYLVRRYFFRTIANARVKDKEELVRKLGATQYIAVGLIVRNFTTIICNPHESWGSAAIVPVGTA